MSDITTKMMAPGKWYLVYTHHMGNCEVPLKANNFDDAKTEANSKWSEILEEAGINWERQKKHWEIPPKTAFGGTDPNPHIVFKCPL